MRTWGRRIAALAVCALATLAACDAYWFVPTSEPAVWIIHHSWHYPTEGSVLEALGRAKAKIVRLGGTIARESEGRFSARFEHGEGERIVASVQARSSASPPVLVLRLKVFGGETGATAQGVRDIRRALLSAARGDAAGGEEVDAGAVAESPAVAPDADGGALDDAAQPGSAKAPKKP